jgi:predicted nucleotidyltransferase
MIQLIQDVRPSLEQLCKRYHVARLEVFGSAATGAFNARSDLDFLNALNPLRISERSIAVQFWRCRLVSAQFRVAAPYGKAGHR